MTWNRRDFMQAAAMTAVAGRTPRSTFWQSEPTDALVSRSKVRMFIHWGPYQSQGLKLPGLFFAPRARSQSRIPGLAAAFQSRQLRSSCWVALAKSAAALHVFTTKHHDGLCMFDSLYTITRSHARRMARTLRGS